mmetsp:Transcript_8058/g.26393  ORF Transcript_8058/g.26393 Transcript_8058/m.26393 type:complete len:486 (-) Transcript_8058:57-1514(-)
MLESRITSSEVACAAVTSRRVPGRGAARGPASGACLGRSWRLGAWNGAVTKGRHSNKAPFRGQHVGHGHGGDQVPRLLRLELVRHDGQVRVQALEEQVRARDDWPPRRNEARVAGRPIPEKVRRALEATSFDRRPLLKVDHRAGVRAHHAEQQVAVLALPRQLGKVPPVADVRREEELVRGRDVRGLEGRQDCGELERVEGVHLGDGLCGDVLQQGLCLGVSGDFGVARVCERRGQRGQQRRRDAVAAESDFGDGGERVRKRIVLLWEEGFVDDAERAREFGRRLEGLGLRRVAEADRKVRGQRGVERLGHADLAVGDGDLCDFVEVEVVKVVVDHEARRQLLEEAFGYELVCPLLLRRRQEARRQHRPEVDHVASRRLCERRRPEGVARVVAVVLARVKVAVGEGPMDLAQGKGHLGELARLQLAAGQVFDARRHGAKDLDRAAFPAPRSPKTASRQDASGFQRDPPNGPQGPIRGTKSAVQQV